MRRLLHKIQQEALKKGEPLEKETLTSHLKSMKQSAVMTSPTAKRKVITEGKSPKLPEKKRAIVKQDLRMATETERPGFPGEFSTKRSNNEEDFFKTRTSDSFSVKRVDRNPRFFERRADSVAAINLGKSLEKSKVRKALEEKNDNVSRPPKVTVNISKSKAKIGDRLSKITESPLRKNSIRTKKSLNMLEEKIHKLESQFSLFQQQFPVHQSKPTTTIQTGESSPVADLCPEKQLDIENDPLFCGESIFSKEIDIRDFVTQVPLNSSFPKEIQPKKDQIDSFESSSLSLRRDAEIFTETPSALEGPRPSFLHMTTNVKSFIKKYSEPIEVVKGEFVDHLTMIYDAFCFSKVCVPIDPCTSPRLLELPAPKKPKTIIFDLDETLVHCTHSIDDPYDVIIEMMLPNGIPARTGFNIRPYAVEVLKELSTDFEIIVFTASHECYANAILDYLDPTNTIFSHRLFRHHCTSYTNPNFPIGQGNSVHVKDLDILKTRRKEDIVIVDNSPYAYSLDFDNGIPILPYYSGKDDEEMIHLLWFLKVLKYSDDVRKIIRNVFNKDGFEKGETLENIVLTILNRFD